jgi:hypothetical protein
MESHVGLPLLCANGENRESGQGKKVGASREPGHGKRGVAINRVGPWTLGSHHLKGVHAAGEATSHLPRVGLNAPDVGRKVLGDEQEAHEMEGRETTGSENDRRKSSVR